MFIHSFERETNDSILITYITLNHSLSLSNFSKEYISIPIRTYLLHFGSSPCLFVHSGHHVVYFVFHIHFRMYLFLKFPSLWSHLRVWYQMHFPHLPSHSSPSDQWTLTGGKNGYWQRREDNSQLSKPSFIMYYSMEEDRLVWVPAFNYPGIPASKINMNALSIQNLATKLVWFNTQV